MSVCSITHDINLDHLCKAVSANLFYCKVTVINLVKCDFGIFRDHHTFFFFALLNDELY